jgi:hypothetical protein
MPKSTISQISHASDLHNLTPHDIEAVASVLPVPAADLAKMVESAKSRIPLSKRMSPHDIHTDPHVSSQPPIPSQNVPHHEDTGGVPMPWDDEEESIASFMHEARPTRPASLATTKQPFVAGGATASYQPPQQQRSQFRAGIEGDMWGQQSAPHGLMGHDQMRLAAENEAARQRQWMEEDTRRLMMAMEDDTVSGHIKQLIKSGTITMPDGWEQWDTGRKRFNLEAALVNIEIDEETESSMTMAKLSFVIIEQAIRRAGFGAGYASMATKKISKLRAAVRRYHMQYSGTTIKTPQQQIMDFYRRTAVEYATDQLEVSAEKRRQADEKKSTPGPSDPENGPPRRGLR